MSDIEGDNPAEAMPVEEEGSDEEVCISSKEFIFMLYGFIDIFIEILLTSQRIKFYCVT